MKNRPVVGVAVAVRRDGKVLFHRRKCEHAFGTWAFAGGHLEMWETFEECALRELREEAGDNLKIKNLRYWTTINTRYFDEEKHVVTIFMVCDWVSGEAEIIEPEKCECWVWKGWYELPSPLMPCLQELVDCKMRPFDL
jgi:8-oxo-dGTP diphosphatase